MVMTVNAFWYSGVFSLENLPRRLAQSRLTLSTVMLIAYGVKELWGVSEGSFAGKRNFRNVRKIAWFAVRLTLECYCCYFRGKWK